MSWQKVVRLEVLLYFHIERLQAKWYGFYSMKKSNQFLVSIMYYSIEQRFWRHKKNTQLSWSCERFDFKIFYSPVVDYKSYFYANNICIPKYRIYQNIKYCCRINKRYYWKFVLQNIRIPWFVLYHKYLWRHIMNCCQIYFTILLNISPFCHQNTLLLSLAWCYTSCVCHPTIKLIGHTFIWHGCTSLATGHWQVISLLFSIQIFHWIL